MNALATQYQLNTQPMLVSIPQEGGTFPIKTLAFAAILVACGSTASQAATIGTARMVPGSSGLLGIENQQDIDGSLADTLDEIKQRSGLTWGQLATIFNVSRRTVHSWANGASVRIAHVGRVKLFLEEVREFGDLPVFKVRDNLLRRITGDAESKIEKASEAPILMSDNSPFVHQLKLRSAKTKVKRG